jgi:hypothetical protein
MDMSVKILFVHGLFLFVVLAVVNGIVVVAPQFYFPGTETTIVTFIVGSILDGAVGKFIAEIWGEYGYEENELRARARAQGLRD